MSGHEGMGGRGKRPAWNKPSVARVGTVEQVRAGAVSRTVEDPFYNPS